MHSMFHCVTFHSAIVHAQHSLLPVMRPALVPPSILAWYHLPSLSLPLRVQSVRRAGSCDSYLNYPSSCLDFLVDLDFSASATGDLTKWMLEPTGAPHTYYIRAVVSAAAVGCAPMLGVDGKSRCCCTAVLRSPPAVLLAGAA